MATSGPYVPFVPPDPITENATPTIPGETLSQITNAVETLQGLSAQSTSISKEDMSSKLADIVSQLSTIATDLSSNNTNISASAISGEPISGEPILGEPVSGEPVSGERGRIPRETIAPASGGYNKYKTNNRRNRRITRKRKLTKHKRRHTKRQ